MARISIRRGMPALALALVVAAVAVVCAEARVPCYRPFTVTGKVQCQDCTKSWNAYAYNAKPIPRSKVGITCKDDRGRVVYHGSDYTDGQGVFNIEVPRKAYDGCDDSKPGHRCDVEPSRCLVRLDSSGDAGCAVFTDFNRGRTGQVPSRRTQASPDKLTYAVGPYYCTLPQCNAKGKDDGNDDTSPRY